MKEKMKGKMPPKGMPPKGMHDMGGGRMMSDEAMKAMMNTPKKKAKGK